MTDTELEGRIVLITGGAQRLGAATARRLHAAGAEIAIHYHTSQTDAEALAEELEAQGLGRARVFGCALDETVNLGPLVESVAATFGGLDILVNNAARFFSTVLRETTEDQWRELMDTNLRAPFFLAQAAQEYLRQKGGCIINLADIYGQRPLADHAVYSVSKAGLIMLTQALAKDLGPEIRVNAVAPGGALWPKEGVTEEHKEVVLQSSALRRLSGSEPVADAIRYLVTADYITGQVLSVEGGRLLY